MAAYILKAVKRVSGFRAGLQFQRETYRYRQQNQVLPHIKA